MEIMNIILKKDDLRAQIELFRGNEKRIRRPLASTL